MIINCYANEESIFPTFIIMESTGVRIQSSSVRVENLNEAFYLRAIPISNWELKKTFLLILKCYITSGAWKGKLQENFSFRFHDKKNSWKNSFRKTFSLLNWFS